MLDAQTEVDDQHWLNEVERLRLLGMDDATIQTRGVLSQPVSVNFDANKLVNVFDYIKHDSGLNMIVNWACLEAAGVEQDCPVTLSLSNVSISQVLDSVIRQACVAEIEPVGFVVRHGIVNVSTMRDLQRTTESRTYDVRNLISTQGDGDVADSLFLDSAHAMTPDEKLTELMTVIVDTVGNQDEWADYGGTVSMVRAYDGRLTITTTPENQYEVAQLLQNLQAGSGEVEAESLSDNHEAVGSIRNNKKRGRPKWEQAREKMLEMLDQGTLPATLQKAAKLLKADDLGYGTVRTAAHRSIRLCEHFQLQVADTLSSGSCLLDELGGTVKRQFLKQPDEFRKEVEREWEHGEHSKAIELVTILNDNPNAGSTGDVSFIENADIGSDRSD